MEWKFKLFFKKDYFITIRNFHLYKIAEYIIITNLHVNYILYSDKMHLVVINNEDIQTNRNPGDGRAQGHTAAEILGLSRAATCSTLQKSSRVKSILKKCFHELYNQSKWSSIGHTPF